jgi:DNA helicase-2/ATP-dependent DNA helicase PcrA
MKDILLDLNEAQQKAVEYTEGPSMVVAGAGSGKTRVLTYRVAHLLNLGIDPFNILALTFTNKAAREMKERIIRLVGSSDARNVWMGTFHSIFARILRIEGHRLGYGSNYTIYDTEDSKRLIKNIIKEQQLDEKVYKINYVLARISNAKINLISHMEYINNFELKQADQMAGKPKIGELYTIYNNRLRKADAMDFDDLLFNTYILLDKFPDVMYKYQVKFKYILVDEYQDTNHVQYMIIKKLAANNENICVVGDDAQSIYAFRGANIQNILNFQNDYPDLEVFKLEQNYRSTKTIVSAANGIIIKNKDQIFKEIWTDNNKGNKIKLIKATTDNEEGNMIVSDIFENKMNHQLPNSSFAILYRTNAQSRAFEEALRRLNISYRIYGGLSFYKRREIKDLLAYFRLVINHKDEDALIRIINYPVRGIGKTTIEKVVVVADKHDVSLWTVLGNPKKYRLEVHSGTMSKISSFVMMINSFSVQLKNKNAYDLGKLIASSSGILKDIYEDQSPEGVSRYENIEELINAMKEFTQQERTAEQQKNRDTGPRRLDEFMQDIALLTDADDKDKKDIDHVSLMTVHAAKGLEFPYIYVTGLEENLFPSIQSLHSRADLEEERRLFYVAVTRAMKQLTVSYADNRYRWGKLTPSEPSRFIEEIDNSYLDIPQRAAVHAPFRRSSEKKSGQDVNLYYQNQKWKNLKKISEVEREDNLMSVNIADLDDFQVGMEVEHKRFGQGKVIHIEGYGDNKKAMVFFQKVGQKQLLLKYARLKILK